MKRKEIQELIADMTEADLTKLSIKRQDGFELVLERQHHVVSAAPSILPSTAADTVEKTAPEAPVDDSAHYVVSPIVGTFYTSPSPDADVFVKVGDKVSEDTVVCIIEAMKVMNEIKAGVSGTVSEVLIESGHPVEFGAEMFKIV